MNEYAQSLTAWCQIWALQPRRINQNPDVDQTSLKVISLNHVSYYPVNKDFLGLNKMNFRSDIAV